MSTSHIIVAVSVLIVLVLGLKLWWFLRWMKKQNPDAGNEEK